MRASIANGGAAFTLSGAFYSGSPTGQESYGYFWSSTLYDGSYMYYRYLGTSSVGPAGTSRRRDGQSIRCVKQSDAEIAWEAAGKPTMQSATAESLATAMPNEGDSVILSDSRDNQLYSVAKINGKLWMTRNLAIGCDGTGSTYGNTIKSITLTSADSNVSSNWTTPTAMLSDASSSTRTADYTTPRMQCSNANNEYGAWYNYAAATAGDITTSSNATEASYSICPKGWRLPSRSEFNGITGSSSAFSPVYSGDYYGGTLNYAGPSGYGGWWSSTAYNSTRRYYLRYSNGSLNVSYSLNRYDGGSVRCVRSS